MYDGDPVAQLFYQLQYMAGKEDAAAVAAKVPHHTFETIDGLRIQTDKRFVQKQDFRIVDKGAGEGQLLLRCRGW